MPSADFKGGEPHLDLSSASVMVSPSLAKVLGSSSGSPKDTDVDDEGKVPEANGPGGAYAEDAAEGKDQASLPSADLFQHGRCVVNCQPVVLYIRCLHASEW